MRAAGSDRSVRALWRSTTGRRHCSAHILLFEVQIRRKADEDEDRNAAPVANAPYVMRRYLSKRESRRSFVAPFVRSDHGWHGTESDETRPVMSALSRFGHGGIHRDFAQGRALLNPHGGSVLAGPRGVTYCHSVPRDARNVARYCLKAQDRADDIAATGVSVIRSGKLSAKLGQGGHANGVGTRSRMAARQGPSIVVNIAKNRRPIGAEGRMVSGRVACVVPSSRRRTQGSPFAPVIAPHWQLPRWI